MYKQHAAARDKNGCINSMLGIGDKKGCINSMLWLGNKNLVV